MRRNWYQCNVMPQHAVSFFVSVLHCPWLFSLFSLSSNFDWSFSCDTYSDSAWKTTSSPILRNPIQQSILQIRSEISFFYMHYADQSRLLLFGPDFVSSAWIVENDRYSDSAWKATSSSIHLSNMERLILEIRSEIWFSSIEGRTLLINSFFRSAFCQIWVNGV